jgi:alkaline phosphatase D
MLDQDRLAYSTARMSKLTRFAKHLCWALLAAVLTVRGAEPVVSNIAFGSCLKTPDHPMLDRTLTLPMDLFVFMGDNIYADTQDMTVMRARYDALKDSRFFRELRRKVPVLATWDDHDFGANDAGRDYPKRRESQEEFLRWIDEPTDSPRRRREGVYDARVFGPPGQRVQIILLDTRYFRSPLARVPRAEQKNVGGAYLPTTDATTTMLGSAQWEWLDAQLRVPAELRLIVSSIQFISEFSGAEAWANLPHEKQRMLDLIRATKANGVLFLSGDRHWCELSRMAGPLGYPLFDLTASALTEKHPRGTPSENRFRAVPATYHDVNVGHLHIDWAVADPVLTLKIIDVDGKPRLEHRLTLNALRAAPGS